MTSRTLGIDPRSAKRAHWLERERIVVFPAVALFSVFVIVEGFLFFRWLLYSGSANYTPLLSDFIGFWSAARLAAEGRPEAAYDWSAIVAVQPAAMPGLTDSVWAWHYPPSYLLLLLPLGLMPYLAALAMFLAANITFWAVLIRRLFSDPRAWIVAAAFPPGLMNFLNGQNGFLTAGLAGFGLLALTRRPIAAGVLIGLLPIKPHLALLFPLALLAGRRWRTIAAAALTALGLTALSLLAFGWPTMQAFLHDVMTLPGSKLAGNEMQPHQVPSLYMSAVWFGLPRGAALVLQGSMALLAGACVWIAWRTEKAPFEAKAATVAAASLLVSPYVYYYDLTWAGLALAFLVHLGMRSGFCPGEREFLAAAWLGSAFAMPVFIGHNPGVHLGWLLPFALTLAATRRALMPPREVR